LTGRPETRPPRRGLRQAPPALRAGGRERRFGDGRPLPAGNEASCGPLGQPVFMRLRAEAAKPRPQGAGARPRESPRAWPHEAEKRAAWPHEAGKRAAGPKTERGPGQGKVCAMSPGAGRGRQGAQGRRLRLAVLWPFKPADRPSPAPPSPESLPPFPQKFRPPSARRRAMPKGRPGGAEAAPPLAGIAAPRKSLRKRPRRSPELRVFAAWALRAMLPGAPCRPAGRRKAVRPECEYDRRPYCLRKDGRFSERPERAPPPPVRKPRARAAKILARPRD
jgi:hypothetical protein